MRNISHWIPQYIFNRISLAIYEKQNPDYPWLTRDAIAILKSLLKKSDLGLEWGSGRSTAWFAARVQHLISAEDNPEWHQIVTEKLKKLDLNNTDYYLMTEPASYIDIVNKFQAYSLDFALVDGSYRDDCAIGVVEKIKLGGVIIIDNVNWYLPSESYSPNSRTYEIGAASEKWQKFLDLVKDWRVIWTSNGVTDTAFFIKTH